MRENKHRHSMHILLACMLFLLSFFQIFLEAKQTPQTAVFVEAVENSEEEDKDGENENDGGEELKIHFYPLGYNEKDNPKEHQVLASGDSFIITVGDTQILVDAGATQESGKAIVRQMQKACGYDESTGTYQDTTWEYVIVTHSDSDHIAAFTSNDEKVKPIFSTLFLGDNAPLKLGKLIDFDISQDEKARKTYNGWEDLYKYKGTVKKVYERYDNARKELKKKYGDEVYSPISALCEEHRNYVEENPDNLKDEKLWEKRAKPLPLADGVTLNFLYNYHNDHRNSDNKVESADINNLSVCFTIDYEKENGGVERFLFTGDLEEFDSSKKQEDVTRGLKRINGESDLVKYNPWLKEGVILYKAAHHGSKTSNSDDLMAAINPQHVVISATAGSREITNVSEEETENTEKKQHKFNFPHQEALDSIYRYTENIYITACDGTGTETGPKDYYGDLLFTYSGGELDVQVGNKEMCKDGKPIPLHQTDWFKANRKRPCHVVTLSGVDEQTGVTFIGNSSLVKLGNTDIVIDCGLLATSDERGRSRQFLNQIDEYCTDGVIEYLLISSGSASDVQQLVDIGENGEIKGFFSRFTVKNIIHFENYKYATANEDSIYKDVCEQFAILEESGVNIMSASTVNEAKTVEEGLTVEPLLQNGEFYGYCVEYQGKDFLFPRTIQEKDEEFLLAKKYDVAYIRVPGFGYALGLSKSLMNKLKEKNKKLYLAINGVAGAPGSMGADKGKKVLTQDYCDMLCKNGKKTFLTAGYTSEGVENMGDIVFTMWYQENTKVTSFDMYSWIGGNIKNSQLYESKYYQKISK